MSHPVLRSQLVRWAVLTSVRSVATTRRGPAAGRVVAASAILSAQASARLYWLVTGRGPWRTLGLSAAVWVSPRGLPPGRFWLGQRLPLEQRPSVD